MNTNENSFEAFMLEISIMLSQIKEKEDATHEKITQIRELLEIERDKIRELTSQKNVLLGRLEQLKKQQLQKIAEDEVAKQKVEMEAQLAALEKEIAELANGQAFWTKARDFQIEDISYTIGAYKSGLNGVLNANDMGLGKTLEASGTIFLLQKLMEKDLGRPPKTLWLTKKTLLKTTPREIRKWCDLMLVPVEGTAAQRKVAVEIASWDPKCVVMANYESLESTPELVETPWDIVVMDEVHKLKGGAQSKPTKVFLNCQKVCKQARFLLPLSGSPLQNHPKEMWTYLHLFDPKKFPSVSHFERLLRGYGSEFTIDFDKLIRAMKGQVIRRRRDEVKLQMPTITPVEDRYRYMELLPRQRGLYNQMRDNFFIWLNKEQDKVLPATAVIAQLIRLWQIALAPDPLLDDPVGSAKVDEAMDLIEQLVEAGESVVVFSSQFNAPLDEIYNRCTKIFEYPTEKIYSNNKEIGETEKRFQEGKTKVLLINMKMGAEGLNLQKSEQWPGGASHVIFLDLWYNPAMNEQALARVYRQGQTDPVSVYILQAEDTVDSFIREIVENKEAMISGVMEDKALRKGSDWKTHLMGKI